MLSGCNIQILESLLPPVVSTNLQTSTGITNHDFLRLSHISACVIMCNEDIAQCLLPLTPAMFFKPLLQAAILNNFYKKDRKLELVPGSLVQLILHWPHEYFVLRELLPSLPYPNFNHLSQMEDTLEIVETELEEFYYKIIELLPVELIRIRSGNASSNELKCSPSWQKQTFKHPVNSPVKKIDISGLTDILFSPVEGDPTYSHLHKLMASVKAAYDPNCPLVYDKDHKLEIICDMRIDVSKKEDLNAVDIISDINSQHGAKFNVIFRKVMIFSDAHLPLKNQLLSLLGMLIKNGTEFLELAILGNDDEIAYCLYPQLQGLQLQGLLYAYTPVISLDFFKNMSNLHQLNLSDLHLRNKLAPLCYLPRGLTFLKLVRCGLTGEDMNILEQSHHTKTLLHFDISGNNFTRPIDASGLIGFIQVLVSVKILRIEECELNELTPDLLGVLFQSLGTLPKLSLLCLRVNYFTSSILSTYIKVLHTCMSLRCVHLTDPSDCCDTYEIDEDFASKINSEINCNRETVINVIWDRYG